MKQKYLTPIIWIYSLYWKTSKLSVIWYAFKAIFDGLIGIVTTYSSAKFITEVSLVAIQKTNRDEVYFWLFLSLFLIATRNIVWIFDSLISRNFSNRIEIIGVEQFIKKIYEFSQEQFDDQEFNTKIERARSGFYRLNRSISTISNLVSALIGLIGSIGAVLILSPILGLIILFTLIPLALIEKQNSKRYEKLYKSVEPYDRTSGRLSWMLMDPLHMPEIRLMQSFKNLLTVWRTNSVKSSDETLKVYKIDAKISAFTNNAEPLLDTGMCIYLLNLLFAGVIGFDRFLFLRGMLEQARSNVYSLSYSLKSTYEDIIALRNYSEIYNTPPAIPNGKIKVQTPLTIEFSNVSFSYPSSSALVLDNISFIVKPGDKIALVGENGAGKTTIVKLMQRQYLPTSGSITVNGIDIRDLDQDCYLRAICSLGQESHVIESLSIRDNLTLGMEKRMSSSEIYNVTDMVDATKFIKKLPNRLSSLLDPSFDKGTNLSGGQKQRLGIARTILRGGDVMILDEPTSAIDSKAEYLIFNNIFKHHADKTTLIISHRFSTVRRASQIIVVEAGRIIEHGTHDELIAISGLYSDMFEKQAEGYR